VAGPSSFRTVSGTAGENHESNNDTTKQTFPAKLQPNEFEGFIMQYEAACRAEGVVLLRVHAGLEAGRAFCFTMAPEAEAVRRARTGRCLIDERVRWITALTFCC